MFLLYGQFTFEKFQTFRSSRDADYLTHSLPCSVLIVQDTLPCFSSTQSFVCFVVASDAPIQAFSRWRLGFFTVDQCAIAKIPAEEGTGLSSDRLPVLDAIPTRMPAQSVMQFCVTLDQLVISDGTGSSVPQVTAPPCDSL